MRTSSEPRGPAPGTSDRPGPGAALLPACLCLCINLLISAGVAARRPEYLGDYRLSSSPDARDYVLLGRNALLAGRYTRCEGPPYAPDMLRTPVYPLFAGSLEVVGGAGAIYLAQAVLHAGSCLLLFGLVRRLFGGRAAFWASLMLATDLMLAVSNFEALSEPLFVFLLLGSCLCLVPPVAGVEPGSSGARLVAGGLLLGLTILTRPAALYLPAVLALTCLGVGARRGDLAGATRVAATFAAIALAPVGLWVARNAAALAVPRLTTVDAANAVYFLGAGAYQVRHGLTLEQAQERVAEEFGLPRYVVLQNPWKADCSVARLDAAVRGAQWRVLARYPKELALSALLGVAKGSVSHNVGDLASLLGRRWEAPGTGSLLALRDEALGRLWRNGPVLAAAFGWQLLHVAASLGLAAAGLVRGLKDRRTRAATLALGGILAYFVLTVAMFGPEAYSRCRIPTVPFLDALAGPALAALAAPGRGAGARA